LLVFASCHVALPVALPEAPWLQERTGEQKETVLPVCVLV